MSEPQVILDAQTVYDAAYYGQRIYAVTEEGLVVLNAGLEEIGRLPLIGGRHVTVRGSTLGIGDGETLHVVDVASPHAPRAVASHVLAGTIVDIRPPGSVTLGRLAVARGGSSGEILVHALEDSQVTEVASFAHTPWFAQGGFVGEAYVRLAADRMSVEAYKVMWRGMV
jgi:hypothetical protein